MSTAVISSSLYDISELILKQQQQQSVQQNDIAKLGWDSLSNDGDTVIGRSSQNLPLSIMTSFLLDNITNTHRRIERTQSEPTKMPAINVTTSSRYKTELCRPFEESGTCKYGDKCQFAHGGQELRCLVRHPKYKTELCRTFHSVGFCPYGPRCHFIHNADEARNNSVNNNNNSNNNNNNNTSSNNNKGNRPRPLTLDTTAILPSPPSSQGSLSPPPGYSFSLAAVLNNGIQMASTAASATVPATAISTTTTTPPNSPPPPPASPERLPVFNRISAPNTSTHHHLLYNNSMAFRFHGSELLV